MQYIRLHKYKLKEIPWVIKEKPTVLKGRPILLMSNSRSEVDSRKSNMKLRITGRHACACF